MDINKLTFIVNRSAEPTKARINIRSVVNKDGIKKTKRNGREVIIVQSATLPDDVVMNRIMYPADEIEASYMTLNRTPAPYGHPMIGNDYVSARDPEGLNIGYIGAWNENPTRRNGRVFLDKVIDVAVANRSDEGKEVLAAINAGGPIHTSTGLVCELEPAEHDDYEYIARNIEFDHDAILLNVEGAATPEQGVGMLVNGKHEDIKVVNSVLEMADRDLDWAVMSAVRALDERKRASLGEQIKTMLLELFSSDEPSNGGKDNAMAVSDEQFNQLSEAVTAISKAVANIGETVKTEVESAVAPIKAHVDNLQANQKAAEQAELDGLVAKIVKANILDEDAAKELTLNAARKLAAKADPGKAAGLNNNGKINGNDKDEFEGYDLNSGLQSEKEAK